MTNRLASSVIRTQPYPTCTVCQTPGESLYRGLQDRLFGAPGNWDFRRCPDCGLIWLDPQPISEDIGLAYATYYTHENTTGLSGRKALTKAVYLSRAYGYPMLTSDLTWSEKMIGYLSMLEPLLKTWLDCSVMFLPYQPSGRLLEVGSGSGELLASMAQLGWQVEGIEVDPRAVAVARQYGVNVHHGDLHAQQYPDMTFDAVVMSHVIEHVYDPVGLLKECYRVLKPAGRLVVLTPNANGWIQKCYAEANFALDPPRHLHYFSVDAISRATQEAGFCPDNTVLRTLARNAHTYLIPTLNIQRSAQHDLRMRPSFSLRVIAKLFQLGQALTLTFKRDVGEEILVIAHR